MTKSRPNLTGSAPINPRPPVSTKHSLIATLGSIRDPQNCCVLFISVPTEIRSIIFSLALYGYDDETRPYPDDAYYSRPGYRFRRRIDTALLATCRIIYGETHDLPISQNEHIFWCGSQRRGPSRKFRDQPAGYLRRLTEEQKAAVTQVHFFTQLIWLDYVFPKVCKLPNMRPKHIKITFRHTDWQYWDENAPLVMTSNWGDNLKFLHGLTTLEVELEALERDEAQVENIVAGMLHWSFPLADSRTLTTEGNPVVSERYLGQSEFPSRMLGYSICYSTADNGWVDVRLSRKPVQPSELAYVVSTVRWTAKNP